MNGELLAGVGKRKINSFGCGSTLRRLGPYELLAILLVSSAILFAQPANDNFANRSTLNGTSIPFTAVTVGATHEAGETDFHSFFASSHSVWYTWKAPSSGGVVIHGAGDIQQPIIAVYTGNDVAILTNVAACMSKFFEARAVFTAVQGQDYQIVVDGVDSDASGEGTMTNLLTLTAPPINDNFSKRTVISGNYFTASGSFLGASREPGEPGHGDTNFEQTLWWTWTAPTDSGTSNTPVSLTADAVSYPPAIAVYTGTSLSNLAPVTLAPTTNGVVGLTNGMTRTVNFIASPGTTYYIALAGTEALRQGNNVISPRFGDFRLRLNNRGLALTIVSVTYTNVDPSEPVTFGADAKIENLGPVASSSLRLLVSAMPGVSVRGQDDGTTASGITNVATWAVSPAVLSPGQSALVHFTGAVPVPSTNDTETFGVGYGVYAELQEEPVPAHWFGVDQALVLFGNWPTVGENPGPDGGVIRLDPGYASRSSLGSLVSARVLGPALVSEGSSVNYTGQVNYADGTVQIFTNTLWSASGGFSITTNGVFTANVVSNNTPVILKAKYAFGGLLYTVSTNIMIIDSSGGGLTGKGTYNGLFSDTNGVAQPNAGFFTATVTDRGRISGKVLLEGKTRSFSGTLNTNGSMTKVLNRPGQSPIQMALNLDLVDAAIVGTLSDGTWISQLTANKAPFNAKLNPCQLAGKFTLVIPGTADDVSLPQGHSVGTLTVDRGGRVKLAGALADGTRFSAATGLSQTGEWPVYAPLYSGRGSI